MPLVLDDNRPVLKKMHLIIAPWVITDVVWVQYNEGIDWQWTFLKLFATICWPQKDTIEGNTIKDNLISV